MFEELKGQPRLLMEADLAPVQGERFQPTGFADLGAAVYQTPTGKRMLLVESAQSMANRFEKAILDGDGPHICTELKGLPYVVAKLSGATTTETSSLVEAHRLNSPFIITDGEFQEAFKRSSGYARGLPLDWRKIGETLFKLDPNSLLHGVFMANLEDGRIKAPRLLTAFIEAENVAEVASGGVKNNPIDPTGTIRAKDYDKNVYSNVPFHRTEYTAERIVAFFNLDLALLDGYGLSQTAKELLIALALYKVVRFLKAGLRLRTACDLRQLGGLRVTEPTGFAIPSEKDLLAAVQEGIKACKAAKLFASDPVTEISTTVVNKKDSKEAAETPSPVEAE
jgi:CRISPR-associated protein Csb1